MTRGKTETGFGYSFTSWIILENGVGAVWGGDGTVSDHNLTEAGTMEMLLCSVDESK